MKFKKLSIVAAMSVIASSSLMAAQMPKFYAGVGYGFGKTSFGSPTTGNQTSTMRVSDDGTDIFDAELTTSADFTAAKTSAYRLFAGAKWQIKKTPWQLGIEYGYNNPFDTKYNTGNTLSEVEVQNSGGQANNIISTQKITIEQTLKYESMDLLAKAFYQVPNSKISVNAGVGFAYSKLKNTITSSSQELQKGEDNTIRSFVKALQDGISYDVSHTSMQPEVSLGGDYYFNQHVFAGVNWRQVFGSDPTYYDTFHANQKDTLSKVIPVIESKAEAFPDGFLNSRKQDVKSAVEASDNKKLPSNYSVTIDVGYQF